MNNNPQTMGPTEQLMTSTGQSAGPVSRPVDQAGRPLDQNGQPIPPQKRSINLKPDREKCKCMPMLIALTVLTVIGLILSGVGIWQNTTLSDQNEKLKLQIAELNRMIREQEKLEYEYNDGGDPATIYKVKLNYGTKKLSVYEHHFCNVPECEEIEEERTITLTDDELKKILDITGKANYKIDYLTVALNALAHGIDVMVNQKDETWNDYKGYDLNDNGTVTYTEFGDGVLDIIIKEQENIFKSNL
ncbi:MAG: hypothetical protein Q4A36_03910 [Candidatus Saccharibacteria bacterium]|nr:hypothetical protein [Candidatus Saccharibacteria bacterium]